MSNYFDTTSTIIHKYRTEESVEYVLEDAQYYWAHRNSAPDSSLRIETLGEHTQLVLDYLDRIVQAHGLEKILDGLIIRYLDGKKVSNQHLVGNYIKKLGVFAIAFHDYGKINANFQACRNKMSNPHFRGKENPDATIGSTHSSLSGFIYLSYALGDISIQFSSQEECALLVYIALLFSYLIYQHHCRCLHDEYWDKIMSETLKGEMSSYLDCFLLDRMKDKRVQQAMTILNLDKLKSYANKHYLGSFDLYALLRLNYSLLTSSDYFATNEFMSGVKVSDSDWGILSRKRIDDIIKRVRESVWMDTSGQRRNYNKIIYDGLESRSIAPLTEISNENLNLLRVQMATEAIRNLRSHKDDRIFYLEAPTGGGKTNIATLITLELLDAHHELNKVFYVFPFKTLIDQTYQSIKSTLGLSDSEIIAWHSSSSFSLKDQDKADDLCTSDQLKFISHLFLHYPFCLLSHIRFFEILKTARKDNNYILHRLANSVVVIDEVQSYPPCHWDKVMYLIRQYAETYHMYFIIMSATLPKIGALSQTADDMTDDDIVNLLPNAKVAYITNPNFANRVAFNFSIINNHKNDCDLNLLADYVVSASAKYAEKDQGGYKPRGSVYTVVAFINKARLTEFKTCIEKKGVFFDEILILSGTILPHRRRYVINYLKRKENRCKKILLITTQVVEAGVDIDMDLGFKDRSLLDSEEQLAGRINRNMNKTDCQLFLFKYDNPSMIYQNDFRFQIMTRFFSEDELNKMLENKDFDRLYDEVIREKKDNNIKLNNSSLINYIGRVEKLEFETVSKELTLIDQDTISCFVPMDVPTVILGEVGEESVFSSSDLTFLERYGIRPNSAERISGKDVYDLYLNKSLFLKNTIEIKQLQGILSKFTFSTFASNKMEKYLDQSRSTSQYVYLAKWEMIYNEEEGLKLSLVKSKG